VWLIYPDKWSQQAIPEDVGFLFIARNSNDTNMTFTRVPITAFGSNVPKTLEGIDQAAWNAQLILYQFTGQQDKVKLESRETIQIGGQPAVRRVFSTPGIQDPTKTFYKMLVLVIKEVGVYQIVVIAASASALRRAEITEIIDSIQFAP
jgi:hypothetical protein